MIIAGITVTLLLCSTTLRDCQSRRTKGVRGRRETAIEPEVFPLKLNSLATNTTVSLPKC